MPLPPKTWQVALPMRPRSVQSFGGTAVLVIYPTGLMEIRALTDGAVTAQGIHPWVRSGGVGPLPAVAVVSATQAVLFSGSTYSLMTVAAPALNFTPPAPFAGEWGNEVMADGQPLRAGGYPWRLDAAGRPGGGLLLTTGLRVRSAWLAPGAMMVAFTVSNGVVTFATPTTALSRHVIDPGRLASGTLRTSSGASNSVLLQPVAFTPALEYDHPVPGDTDPDDLWLDVDVKHTTINDPTISTTDHHLNLTIVEVNGNSRQASVPVPFRYINGRALQVNDLGFYDYDLGNEFGGRTVFARLYRPVRDATEYVLDLRDIATDDSLGSGDRVAVTINFDDGSSAGPYIYSSALNATGSDPWPPQWRLSTTFTTPGAREVVEILVQSLDPAGNYRSNLAQGQLYPDKTVSTYPWVPAAIATPGPLRIPLAGVLSSAHLGVIYVGGVADTADSGLQYLPRGYPDRDATSRDWIAMDNTLVYLGKNDDDQHTWRSHGHVFIEGEPLPVAHGEPADPDGGYQRVRGDRLALNYGAQGWSGGRTPQFASTTGSATQEPPYTFLFPGFGPPIFDDGSSGNEDI